MKIPVVSVVSFPALLERSFSWRTRGFTWCTEKFSSVLHLYSSHHLSYEALEVRVPELPHSGPHLPPALQPHVLLEVRFSDVVADRSEQVDKRGYAGQISKQFRPGRN